MRDRLARMGRGGEHDDQALLDQEAGEAPLGSVPPQLSARPGPYSASGLGTVAEEGGGTAGSEAAGPALGGPDAGHFGVADPAEGSGTGQAVKQKISSGFQAVGRSLSKVKTKLSDRQGAGGSSAGAAFDEVTDRDQDVAVRVGLAAFAVSGAGVRLHWLGWAAASNGSIKWSALHLQCAALSSHPNDPAPAPSQQLRLCLAAACCSLHPRCAMPLAVLPPRQRQHGPRHAHAGARRIPPPPDLLPGPPPGC